MTVKPQKYLRSGSGHNYFAEYLKYAAAIQTSSRKLSRYVSTGFLNVQWFLLLFWGSLVFIMATFQVGEGK